MISPDDTATIESRIADALAGSAHDEAAALAARYVQATGDDRPSARPEESPWFRARYLAAQSELAAGRLVAAAGQLESLAPVERALPSQLARRVHLLAAEVLARLGRAAEARVRLAQVGGGPGEALPAPIRARVLRVRLALGEVEQLGGELSACEAALGGVGDSAGAALLACDAGLGWAAAGDMARAEACWLRAERTSTPLGSSNPVRADALLQLGRLDHLRGQWQRALDRYRDALENGAARTAQEAEIRLRRALIYIELGHATEARDEYSSATVGWRSADRCPEELRGLATIVADLAGCPRIGPTVDPLAGDDDESLGFRKWVDGDLVAAREAYARAFASTSAPERQARHALALALTALASGEPAAASPWLFLAKELADRFDLAEVRWRSRQGLGRLAAEWRDDEEGARAWFEEAEVIGEAQDASLRRLEHRSGHRKARGDVLGHLLAAAGRRGDPDGVLHYQELARGRHLLELWQSSLERRPMGDTRPAVPTDVADLDRRIEELDRELADPAIPGPAHVAIGRTREEWVLRRDRARDQWLADPSRASGGTLPTLVNLRELERRLPRGGIYAAPSLVGDDLIFLIARPGKGGRVIRSAGAAPTVRAQAAAFRRTLSTQLDRFRSGLTLDQGHRSDLDCRLTELGDGPLGRALATAMAWGCEPATLLVWAPDDELHGLPISALRLGGRYLIEDLSVVNTFSASLIAHQVRARCGWRWRLRRRRAVVVAGSPDDSLRYAEPEGRAVLAAFETGRMLRGVEATRAAVRDLLARARVVHFACHADVPRGRPHRARVELPSGEYWYASEWPHEPVRDLPLVTLSACRSGEVASLFGREVFGLVSGVLGGGARAVVAGLWSVPDRQAMPFMFAFYHHLMAHDPTAALARAQRDALGNPDSHPLFWSVFAIFGHPQALPPPVSWMGWWVRRRQIGYLARCREIQQDLPESLRQELGPAGQPN
jgi:tetratricopeptide (TPR) repeat protein